MPRPASVLWSLFLACVHPGSQEPARLGRGAPIPTATSQPAATRPGPDAAAIERHVAALRRKTTGESFHIVVEAPFVVVGDDDAEAVEDCAVRTVRWARERLRKQFFARDPEQLLDVWLFKDKTSYEAHCRRWFGGAPDTPYGFFSARHQALIMNIATGTGTLVHELVHPYIATNLPDCPPWFNEGLASLYEQCGDVDGRIVGRPNWRLPGLKEALLKGKVPGFARLLALTSAQFYGDDQGVHYAQARYLCYYLQQHGLLETFYRRLVTGIDKDPTGFESLQAVLGTRDMDRFMADWSRFVMDLRYNGS